MSNILNYDCLFLYHLLLIFILLYFSVLHYKDHIHESFVIFAHLRRCVLNPGGKKRGLEKRNGVLETGWGLHCSSPPYWVYHLGMQMPLNCFLICHIN